jgi:hypothetical protein
MCARINTDVTSRRFLALPTGAGSRGGILADWADEGLVASSVSRTRLAMVTTLIRTHHPMGCSPLTRLLVVDGQSAWHIMRSRNATTGDAKL